MNIVTEPFAHRYKRAAEIFRRVAEGQSRRMGVPVRDSFFRCERDGVVHHPLAELMRTRDGKPGGGRGGRTRVLLYLSLLWVVAGNDHSTDRPARFWAEMLAMQDPKGHGARTISSTWAELKARQYVSITPGDYSGDPPRIAPLREDGSGDPYELATGLDGDTYRRIPDLAVRMLFPDEGTTGAALAMYLVALRTADRARSLTDLTVPRAHVRAEYGFGERVRTSGLKDLERMSILDGRSVVTGNYGDPDRRGWKRDVYSLTDGFGPLTLQATFLQKSRLERPGQRMDASSAGPNLGSITS